MIASMAILPPIPPPFAAGTRVCVVGPRRLVCGAMLVEPGSVGVVLRVNVGVGIAVYPDDAQPRRPVRGSSVILFPSGAVALAHADEASRFRVLPLEKKGPR